MQTLNPMKLSRPSSTSVNNSSTPAYKLPQLLRGLGSAAIVLSLYFFFMRGWDDSNDLTRYLLLFGHTVGLSALGLGIGHWLKESKGARALLALSMVAAIANFSILGSFLYSSFGEPLSHTVMPSMQWSLNNAGQALLLTCTASAILACIIIIGLRVLARGMSRDITTLFLLSNSILLLPIREPVIVSILALALSGITLWANIRSRRQHLEAKTFEGIIALALPFAPIATLLIRNIWLYGGQDLLSVSIFVMGFFALRQTAPLLNSSARLANAADACSAICAVFTGFFAFNAVTNMPPINPSIGLIVCTLLISGMLYELSLRATKFNTVYRIIAGLTAAIFLTYNMLNEASWLADLVLSGTGVVFLTTGRIYKQRITFGLGTIMLIAGLLNLSTSLWTSLGINIWLALAAVGICAIVIGSILESKGDAIRKKLLAYTSSYSDWDY